MTKKEKDIKRFWKYVDKTDYCWNWTGIKDFGYGRFYVTRGGKKKGWKAHRYSYELHIRKIPKRLLVCHTCDNRACVKPDHLFLGTYKDNNYDCIKKGRAKRGVNRGEQHYRAIYTEDFIKKIRMEYEPLETDYQAIKKKRREFREKYKMSQPELAAIIKRKIWKHI